MGQSWKSKIIACRSSWLLIHDSCLNNLDLVYWGQTHQAFDTIPAFNYGDNTWFFPFNIRRLVTLPKGKPKEMTSASVTSLGSLRTWITRDGTPALLLSPLNFLLSFPLAVKSKSYCLLEWVWKNMHTLTTLDTQFALPIQLLLSIIEKFHSLI